MFLSATEFNVLMMICRVSQVFQAPTETKEQRDQEDRLGSQVWTDSQDNW